MVQSACGLNENLEWNKKIGSKHQTNESGWIAVLMRSLGDFLLVFVRMSPTNIQLLSGVYKN